jgi:tetratricopeptide (TPR) repeat protein
VPLYAVETVRMLVTDGRLKAVDGVFQPVGDLAQLAVPESLTELIAARLDGLEPADRSLLEDAAVVGQSFTLAALSGVSGFDESDLEPRLRALVRREVLTLQADPRSPERGQYAFVQALIREVAYNTLARKERKARHLAAARFFEAHGTDELAAALAGQYLAAYQSAAEGEEADALAAQARIALRAAAERASALGSHRQAGALIEQALTVTTDAGEQAELLERAGEFSDAAGRHEVADGYLRRAIDGYRKLGDRQATARATSALARALLSGRQGDVALRLLNESTAEFADLGGTAEWTALAGQLARAYFLNDRHRYAIEAAETVLETAEHNDLPAIVADTLITKGSALATIGRLAEGMALIRAGMEIAESRGLQHEALRAIGNLGAFGVLLDPRAALEIGRKGVALMRRLGTTAHLHIVGNAANAAMRVGEWDWAAQELDEWLAADVDPVARAELASFAATRLRACRGEPFDELLADVEGVMGDSSDPYRLASLHMARANAALAAGKLREARAGWLRAYELLAFHDTLGWTAKAALWSGDGDGAREDLGRLDAAGPHGAAVDADRVTIRAGIAALEGRQSDALALYRQALAAWRSLGLAWDEASCAIDMATLLDPAEPDVQAAAEAGRSILERLEARPFLERLDAAMRRTPPIGAPTPAPEGVASAPRRA